MLRTCSFCRKEKELISENFARHKDGFQWACRPCQKEYRRQNHHRNANKQKEKAAARKKLQNELTQQFLLEYRKKHPCQQCGESHVATLDFHHRDPKTKEGSVSVMLKNGWAIERAKKEIEKCDVLCANCHRKLHWSERNSN